MLAGHAAPGSPGPRGAPRPELRCNTPVPASFWPRVHSVSRNGRVRSSVVRGDQEGPDGVSDQKVAGRRGHTMRQGQNMPARKVCGQDPQEALFGEFW